MSDGNAQEAQSLYVRQCIIHAFRRVRQGSRLTFQLASPVASDRFDPLAKTNFSLARHRHLLL